jgi:hypothetical protein
MSDTVLARLARLDPSDDRGWVCRTRLEHLDWRPLVAAGLVEQAPALGHVRLTAAGREQVAAGDPRRALDPAIPDGRI